MEKIAQATILECQVDNDGPQKLHKRRLVEGVDGASKIYHRGGSLRFHLSISCSVSLTL